MTSIIFDTNCFWNKYYLNDPILSSTIKLCLNSEGLQFVLPEIVKEEVKNNFKKQLQKRFSRIKDDINWYNNNTSRNEAFLNEDQFTEDIINYHAVLEKIISDYDIIEFAYPKYNHSAIVNRNLKRLKPFSDNDSGYKDTLIWLNIIDYLSNTDDSVIFVSENKSDFGKQNTLDKELLEELTQLEIEHGRIRYYNSLNSFFDEIVKPQLQVLDILDDIRNDVYDNFDFDAYIEENIQEMLSEKQDSIDLSSISNSLQRPVIDWVDEIPFLELRDGKRIDENEVFLEYGISIITLTDVLIDRHYPLSEKISKAIHIFNHNFNSSFMEGEIYLNLGATLLILFETDKNEVISNHLENIIVQDYN